MRRTTEDEFLAAYDQHADAIFRFCYAQTGEREAAKDAVQETFVRTWKYLADGRRVKELRPFLYRTARNILIDNHRRDRTDSLDALSEHGFDIGDKTDMTVAIDATLAVKAMQRLEPGYREAVLLRYVHEMSPAEIAQVTGEKVNAISVRIHRGLEKLKELFREDER